MLLFTVAIGIHRKTTKTLNDSLKARVPLYDRFWQWQHRKRIRIPVGILAVLCATVFIFGQYHNVFALSTWSQSDWSGGVGSSTANQYSSGSNVDVSVANQATIARKSQWYNPAWSFRKQITIDHTKVSAAQANFPVLIELPLDTDLKAHAQVSGNDILVTDSSGTAKLSHEIESFDSSTGALVVWVKVPVLSSTIDTTLYLYYGNAAAANQQDATGTWNNQYSGVFPMNESSGTAVRNSTMQSPDGTVYGASVSTGKFGNARYFDGGTNYIQTGITNGTTMTVSTWATSAAFTGAGVMLFNRQVSTGPDLFITGGSASWNTWDGQNNKLCNLPANVTNGSYHYYSMVVAPGNTALYIDGALCGTATYKSPAGPLYISSNAGYDWNGTIDEFRVSKVARSAAWIATSYQNQNDPSSFMAVASQEQQYESSGSLTSSIFDTSLANDWANLTDSAIVPAGTTLSVKVRAGSQADLSDAPAFSSCAVVAAGADITSTCAPDKSRYVQYQVAFTSDGAATPTLNSIGISYSPSDTVAPTVNATNVSLKTGTSGDAISSNGWAHAYPYAAWTAGQDDSGGSGIKGYCLYLGHDPTGNPITTKGDLGSSQINTAGTCQFAVDSNSVDLSQSGYIGIALESSTTPYYLNIIAIDNANNVYIGAPAQFQFRFDNTPPTNPTFVSAPSQFVSSKSVNITWPISNGQQADDDTSGVAGLQYKIGSGGTWYGSNHTGSSGDLLPNDGSYTTVVNPDFGNLSEGANIIYFRTLDNAGNISAAYVTSVIKINTSSPSSPQNLSATPTTNTTNSFAFSWLAPATSLGSVSNITYCYTVNTIPNANNCQYTLPGILSLSPGAYATQPGENTFYVVAKDEAGNVNYSTAANTTFTADTPAPGVPTSLDIADISVKVNQIWKTALSWEAPTMTGAGIASYHVYRSMDGSNYLKVASTAGTSYVDTGLSQRTYYYKIAACDSANNCGVFTNPVQIYPTGKFTTPASLITGPDVTTTTRSATIVWTTDRNSDSKIEYGLSSGVYFSTAASNVQQTNAHTITLNNLNPSTTYFFRSTWSDIDGNAGTSVEKKFTTLPAPTVSDVTVSGINLSDATINFTVDGAVAATLYYGPNGSLGATKAQSTSTSSSRYSVPLSGLADGTQYSFRIDTSDAAGNEYKSGQINTFTTPPAPHITNVQFEPVSGALSGTETISWTTNVPATSQIRYVPQGQPLSSAKEAISTTMSTEHTMTIDNLTYGTSYQIIATSQDAIGNVARSDIQVFRTGLDTRPPRL
ncbi:MAG: DUF2341 domain-containing protein, partial [Candidatus Saccharimonas sp.]